MVPLALAMSACGDKQAQIGQQVQAKQPVDANQSEQAAADFKKRCRKFLKAQPPANPGRDILGIYPGMNAAAALITLKCKFPEAQIRELGEEVWYAPGKTTQVRRIELRGDVASDIYEEMSFTSGGIKGDQRVLYVKRDVRYRGDAEPDLEETLKGLEKKYGQRLNLRQKDQAVGQIVHSRSGTSLTDASSSFAWCVEVASRNSYGSSNRDFDPAVCGLTITYRVNEGSSGRVNNMQLTIDNPADTTARIMAQMAENKAERPAKSADF